MTITANDSLRLLRRLWWRLISMRTALILLFLLAVAAVPGSLLPQRSLNASKTESYIASHGAWGRLLDHLGMFDVFASTWFAAIYLLLFISLIGCLVPRIKQHAKALRAKPLPAPKNLGRLPESGSFETAASAQEYATSARAALGRRWRVERRQEKAGVVTLSAEKGYSRETGNLVFHVALLVALIAIAVGRLYTYTGTRVVLPGSIADQGFCANAIFQYDSWQPGRLAEAGDVKPAPYCFGLTDFSASYNDAGEPLKFTANVTYQKASGGPIEKHRITVNNPLRIDGDRVYLISHGFAPQITVTMPDGSTQTSVEPFVPTDPATYLSEGAFKFHGPSGEKKDIGIEGFFAPTPVAEGGGAIGDTTAVTSASPKPDNPVLGVTVYTGDLGSQTQSIYSLDQAQKDSGALSKFGGANLREGQTLTISNGVKVRFDGWTQWAALQISHDPSQIYLLVAAAAMVVGLISSLFVRRRRLWLRITPATSGRDPSPTVVWIGGLARSDSGNFTEEFAGLLERLRQAGPPVEPALRGADDVAVRKE
ncbi:MAG: cytochrome c biogenesis protein ResB [Actinobacteria bacterium]|nr:cytochrome c biogenesis protein ResB [Actinomycetota bacterium]